MIDHLSYSSISKYLKCHRQWKHKYIDGWEEPTSDNLIFGKAFHMTIQDVLNGNDNIGNAFTKSLSSLTEGKNDFEYAELADVGMRMVSTDLVSETIYALNPMSENIERKFELHIPGVEVPIIGYIDMIENSTLIPIDFKTASRKWPVDRAETELQATFYIAAMEQAGMITLPHTFRYIVFTKTAKPTVQIIETERTATHVFELHEMVNDVWQAIKNGSFGKCAPGMWWCSSKYCGFYDRCKG